MSRKTKKPKPPSARQLFEEFTRQLADLNRRYESLFRYVNDPKALALLSNTETITITLDRDMEAGQSLTVRVPAKFEVRL